MTAPRLNLSDPRVKAQIARGQEWGRIRRQDEAAALQQKGRTRVTRRTPQGDLLRDLPTGSLSKKLDTIYEQAAEAVDLATAAAERERLLDAATADDLGSRFPAVGGR